MTLAPEDINGSLQLTTANLEICCCRIWWLLLPALGTILSNFLGNKSTHSFC